jgi:hypothetical protein
MQQGDGSIELFLGFFGAADGEVNGAQGVAGVLVDRDIPSARAARKQDGRQSRTDMLENRSRSALDGWLPLGGCAATHTRVSHALPRDSF